jgi:hypothetical protein
VKYLRLVVVLVACWLLSSSASAGIEIGLSADRDGINSFHLAIGEHVGVEQKIVVKARERKIPEEELPVVFFLARHASVSPSVIIDLRLDGRSWMDIALHYGLHADVFYVPLKDPGPPYGKAWGHFKKKKKSEWSTIRLSDSEIAASVNLKFISSHYGCSPDEVAAMRADDKSFVSINSKVKKKKAAAASKPRAQKDDSKSAPKGKGKKKK